MKLTIIRADFSGGMNYSLGDSSKLESSEYVFLSNGRSRNGRIVPVKSPVRLELPVAGLVQGIYGAGDFLLVFVSGEAYYKRTTDSYFTKVKTLRLSSTAARIWAEVVPASTINRSRLLTASENEAAGVKFSGFVPGTPAGVVVSDGTNRPWVIFATGEARPLATYDEWDVNGTREYVPTGITNLVWANGRLYGLVNNAVVGSVTGRPTDFVVNIDAAGDKPASEEEGGAESLGHRADFSTALSLSRTNVGSLLLATASSVYVLTPDFDNTLFGEHTFTQQQVSNVGVASPLSGISLEDDFAYVDLQGPKVLREVSYTKDAPAEAGFASKLAGLFEGVTQSDTAAVVFNTYAYFLVQTIFGSALAVWDILNKRWTSVDQYQGISSPKFLATAGGGGQTKLYIATASEVWECFASSSNYETLRFYPFDQTYLSSEDGSLDHDIKPTEATLFFSAAYEPGTVSVIPYSSEQGGAPVTIAVSSTTQDQVSMPFARSFSSIPPRLTVPLPNSISGWRLGLELRWAFNVELSYVALTSKAIQRQVSIAQQISA